MESFFNKDTYSEDDIKKVLKDQFEESLNLEFKESRSLEKTDKNKLEISKDVSSFANSAGGIIVYGITEKDHKASSISYIDGNIITKEWIENVIDSNIHRRISGLKIYPIRINDKIEQTTYLVKIPQSSDAPHMATDNKYYKRFNFKSVPMEEYEVRNLFNRLQTSKIKIVDPLVTQNGSFMQGQKIKHTEYYLTFQVENVGNTIEKDYKLEVYIPAPLYRKGSPQKNLISKYYIRDEEIYSVFAIPNISPIFQEELTTLIIAHIRMDKHNFQLINKVNLKVKLYFTGGTELKEFNLSNFCKFGDRDLQQDDFI